MPFNGLRFLHTLSHICTGKYKPMTAFLVSQALAGIALLLIILSFNSRAGSGSSFVYSSHVSLSRFTSCSLVIGLPQV